MSLAKKPVVVIVDAKIFSIRLKTSGSFTMGITVGAAALKAVQTSPGQSSKAETQSRGPQAKSEAHSQAAGGDEKNAVMKAALTPVLTPVLRQAAQIVAGPLGEVAVAMAAGAVGALLDTRA
jgi:hypothetical protein